MTGPANDNGALNCGWSHIELSAATVTDAYLENASGRHSLPNDLGFRFFVDAIDATGGRLALHSCDSYDKAINLAEEARTTLEVDKPVVDRVGEGR